jgi:hypothetical protein
MKLILAGVFIFSTQWVLAQMGGVTGNGGDRRAIEFVVIAEKIAQYVTDAKKTEVDIEKFHLAIATTKVESTNKILKLKGIPKDAINYPQEKRIIFNRESWDSSSDESIRAVLVFHEYLGIMGVDDSSYKYSKKILKDLSFGQASGFEAQDALSEKVIRTTIQGQIAKKMYHHLNLPIEVISGVDGEQLTKTARGIVCAVMSGSEKYTCYLEVGPDGVMPSL